MTFKSRSALINLSLLLAALLISLIILEVALQNFFGLGTPVLYRIHSDYGNSYSPVPNQKISRRRGSTVTIDSYGLRTAVDWGKEADHKILFVGDSVTYGGSYIDDSELFSDLTCQMLNKNTSQYFNCGNAGVNAWGTDNMSDFLRYKSFNDENIIVVTLITGDAERGRSKISGLPFWNIQPPEPFPASIEAGMFVIDKYRLKLRYSVNPEPALATPDYTEYITRSLEKLFQILEEKKLEGKQIILVHSPSKHAVTQGYSEADLLLIKLIKKSPFTVIIMKDHLELSSTDFFYDAVHLERSGHLHYAKVFSQKIKESLK